MSNMIEEMLRNNCIKAILKGVDCMNDVKVLRYELKSYIRDYFDSRDVIRKAIKVIERSEDYKFQKDIGLNKKESVLIEVLSILKGENK